jgi:hypothetical protein
VKNKRQKHQKDKNGVALPTLETKSNESKPTQEQAPPPSRHLYGSKSYGEYLIRTANVATANDYWNKKRTTPAKKPSCSTIITVMTRHLYDYCYVYFLSVFLRVAFLFFCPFFFC